MNNLSEDFSLFVNLLEQYTAIGDLKDLNKLVTSMFSDIDSLTSEFIYSDNILLGLVNIKRVLTVYSTISVFLL